MPNAIDTKKFEYDQDARVRLRNELNIPQDVFVIGHVGRFMFQKNHLFLLQVLKAVLRQKENAFLLLVGEGELQEAIRQNACELGLGDRVIFTGARKDVEKLYSAMDVFCLPSFYEGLPVVALEAQANGLPCVLSNRITTEMMIHKNVKMLPLDDFSEWCTLTQYGERIYCDEMEKQYEIQSQANRLLNFYISK